MMHVYADERSGVAATERAVATAGDTHTQRITRASTRAAPPGVAFQVGLPVY
jgi:predicted RNA polymerase sigma factor